MQVNKYKESAKVVSHERLASDIYSMWIEVENISKEAAPGQFVSVYTKDKSLLLPRPISLCEVDKINNRIRLVYRVVGKGTHEFSAYKAGDFIDILGPVGNGFPVKDINGDFASPVFIIGGGIGIPPMLELSKNITISKKIILGYRDELFLNDEFMPYGDVYIATEDGSAGTKGNVLDVLEKHNLSAGIICACGPTPMLRAIKQYSIEHNIKCYLSLEERMACGVGACLACVCKTTQRDDHSNVNNKRVCVDGPVFLAEEVQL